MSARLSDHPLHRREAPKSRLEALELGSPASVNCRESRPARCPVPGSPVPRSPLRPAQPNASPEELPNTGHSSKPLTPPPPAPALPSDPGPPPLTPPPVPSPRPTPTADPAPGALPPPHSPRRPAPSPTAPGAGPPGSAPTSGGLHPGLPRPAPQCPRRLPPAASARPEMPGPSSPRSSDSVGGGRRKPGGGGGYGGDGEGARRRGPARGSLGHRVPLSPCAGAPAGAGLQIPAGHAAEQCRGPQARRGARWDSESCFLRGSGLRLPAGRGPGPGRGGRGVGPPLRSALPPPPPSALCPRAAPTPPRTWEHLALGSRPVLQAPPLPASPVWEG
ncbi:basic proline-rich protein-like [Monodon monoceros]|uniref:basic proline-rich protein-like n=1 Tax=Monodon monoceros TaxID=40151 RepID=UPI0010FA13FE|nr:basic proline-rich protein-like [Monodon monoceros]